MKRRSKRASERLRGEGQAVRTGWLSPGQARKLAEGDSGVSGVPGTTQAWLTSPVTETPPPGRGHTDTALDCDWLVLGRSETWLTKKV